MSHSTASSSEQHQLPHPQHEHEHEHEEVENDNEVDDEEDAASSSHDDGSGGAGNGGRRSYNIGRRDFTVAKKTDFKKLAAKIAGEARKGAIQNLRAMGANNINTVVKGFALARRYIEEQNIDVNCFVQFIEVGR